MSTHHPLPDCCNSSGQQCRDWIWRSDRLQVHRHKHFQLNLDSRIQSHTLASEPGRLCENYVFQDSPNVKSERQLFLFPGQGNCRQRKQTSSSEFSDFVVLPHFSLFICFSRSVQKWCCFADEDRARLTSGVSEKIDREHQKDIAKWILS